MLMDDGRVRGFVRMTDWSAAIRDNSSYADASLLEVGWTSLTTTSDGTGVSSQLVIEEPDFSDCSTVYESTALYDTEDRYRSGNTEYEADLTAMHEISRLAWDDLCINLKMQQIRNVAGNVKETTECHAREYKEFLDTGWGRSFVNVHQLWTGLNLDGCLGWGYFDTLGAPLWGASVVEGLDCLCLDWYSPYVPNDMAWASTHEIGHNHGVSDPEHYNDCNPTCNLMYPGFPENEGFWWTNGAANQIEDFAYPHL